MHYETYEHYALRLTNAALAEHAQEISAFTDATAIRATYGTKFGLSESLAHARVLHHLRTKSAILLRAQREWLALAYKDDDPDNDWDDNEHTPGDEPWHWKFGAHKSPQRWKNLMVSRDWTPNQITKTIAEGVESPAPNDVHPGNPAINYELNGTFVVRDEATKEILQISRDDFIAKKLPGQE